MIKGLGTDIIEVDRIKKLIEKYKAHFLDKIFTKAEQDYCQQYGRNDRHYAGRYAAKEAVVKAFGVGFGEDFGFKDIEITNDPYGKPQVTFSPKAQQLLGNQSIVLSISHCNSYATAVAILFQGSD